MNTTSTNDISPICTSVLVPRADISPICTSVLVYWFPGLISHDRRNKGVFYFLTTLFLLVLTKCIWSTLELTFYLYS